jgi:tRNA 2-thiouridine synthesizing protein A
MASQEELEEFQEEPALRLNTVGLICPYPALETQKALSRLEKGQVLEVITNNEPTAKKSIPILCERSGAVYRVIEEDDRWRILIRK